MYSVNQKGEIFVREKSVDESSFGYSLLAPYSQVGNIRSNNADDNENVKKTIGLISKTTTSHVHHTFLYISFPFLHDYDLKMLISRFIEDVNKQRRNFISQFPSLNMVLWNSAPGGFAYIWQSKWLGIIAITTERTQIRFLSDVLVAVASLDLKVPSINSDHADARITKPAIRKGRKEFTFLVWQTKPRDLGL